MLQKGKFKRNKAWGSYTAEVHQSGTSPPALKSQVHLFPRKSLSLLLARCGAGCLEHEQEHGTQEATCLKGQPQPSRDSPGGQWGQA